MYVILRSTQRMGRLILSTRITIMFFLICWCTMLYTTTPFSLLTSSILLFVVIYAQGYTWQAHPLLLVTVINAVHVVLHAVARHHEDLDEPIIYFSVFLECFSFTGMMFWPIPMLPPPSGVQFSLRHAICRCGTAEALTHHLASR